MTEKTEKEILQEIGFKLDKIMGVLAVSNIKEPKDKIPILTKLGFTIEETALFTGLTVDIVKKRKSQIKKIKNLNRVKNWL